MWELLKDIMFVWSKIWVYCCENWENQIIWDYDHRTTSKILANLWGKTQEEVRGHQENLQEATKKERRKSSK